jgi:ferric-dicitrate binding protein FerR (iron transport regulator)
MIVKDDIDILILDHFNGTLTSEGEVELKKWIGSSDENKAYFVRTIAYLETTAFMRNHQWYPSDKAWQKLKKKINPALSRRKFIFEFSKIAAVFILAFLLGYLFLYLRNEQAENKEAHRFVITEVPYGSKSVISLPDGSRVWINAGSKITYSIDFNKKDRNVALEGEAYFDIVTDRKRPFFVESSGIKVKATGTQFNVRAYLDEEFIETTLVEGEISVMKAVVDNEKEIVLHPNQKLTIYKDKVSLSTKPSKEKQSSQHGPRTEKKLQVKKIELESNVSTEVYTSWKDKEWVIYKEKLGTLARKLERRYNVQIFFNDDFVEDFSYTGTLQDENLKEVLDVMSLTSPICYKLEDKTVRICYNPSFNEKH